MAYRAGLRRSRVEGYESFHWPSTASPLVDKELLKAWQQTSTDREYRREVLAEWVENQGAYFTAEELDTACCDYELVPPERARGGEAVAGVDWGFATDANALVLLAVDELLTAQRNAGGNVYAVPWVEEAFRTPYAAFIDRVVDVADNPWRNSERSVYMFSRQGYRLTTIVSEQNGVGEMPTQELAQRLQERRLNSFVLGVHTDARLKEDGFGVVKMWAQQGRLALLATLHCCASWPPSSSRPPRLAPFASPCRSGPATTTWLWRCASPPTTSEAWIAEGRLRPRTSTWEAADDRGYRPGASIACRRGRSQSGPHVQAARFLCTPRLLCAAPGLDAERIGPGSQVVRRTARPERTEGQCARRYPATSLQHHGHRGTLSDQIGACPSINNHYDGRLLDLDSDDFGWPESGGSCAASITGARHRDYGAVRASRRR